MKKLWRLLVAISATTLGIIFVFNAVVFNGFDQQQDLLQQNQLLLQQLQQQGFEIDEDNPSAPAFLSAPYPSDRSSMPKQQGTARQKFASQHKPIDKYGGLVDAVIHAESRNRLVLNGAKEKFHLTQRLNGVLWLPPEQLKKGSKKAAAEKFRTLSSTISTSLIYSFSPGVDKRIRSMFPDWMNEYDYYTNSPALHWDSVNSKLIVVLRIWLDRERFEAKKNWPVNVFMDNYFYTQSFDAEMMPIDKGSIMGIPANAAGGDSLGDGPIEPRLFLAPFGQSNESTSKLYVSYNAGMTNPFNKPLDYTLMWDYADGVVHYPLILGYSPMVDNPDESFPRDKHWAAFNLPTKDEATVFFVHNLDPLRILRCNASFICAITHVAGSVEDNKFNDLKHHLRGGTPFVLYRWLQPQNVAYYVGFAHVTLFKKHVQETRRYYTTNLVVLRVNVDGASKNADNAFRIVYTSNPIKISPELLASVPIVRYMYIEDAFIFPVGLVLENLDTAVLGVHINDHSAVLLRIRGLARMLEDVIVADSRADLSSPSSFKEWPSVGEVNRFSRLAATEELGGTEFEDGHDDAESLSTDTLKSDPLTSDDPEVGGVEM